EDVHTLAFMNLNQLNDGHVLIIPKAHFVNVFDIPSETLGHVIQTVKKVSHLIKANLGISDQSIWQSNGAKAGQDVWHLHYHVLPRLQEGELRGFYSHTPKRPLRQELDQIALKIKGNHHE
ncbi:MAG: HIT domain-containing protein, partial [Chloroflexota bacterium]